MKKQMQAFARRIVLKSYWWWCTGVLLGCVLFWPIVIVIGSVEAVRAFINTWQEWSVGDFGFSTVIRKCYFDKQRRIDSWEERQFLNDPKTTGA